MSVWAIFGQAQKSASHRSLVAQLRRLEATTTTDEFGDDFLHCVTKVLLVGKQEPAGNRVVKFVELYFESSSSASTDAMASATLSSLLPYLSAKDRTIRFRSIQLISRILGVLKSIDDDLYRAVRHELIKRLRDKVPAVRLEAVVAVGRLAENEMAEQEEEDDGDDDSDYEASTSSGLLETLLDVLQNDTNADVRRALLLNLPLTPTTLPYLLERARDRDGQIRRALYSRILPTLGDFRHLSLSMREKLLRWGLRDRDERVRKATSRVFRERWVEDCAGSGEQVEKSEAITTLSAPSIPALLELLERIDVINSGVDTGVAQEAMMDFWAGRPDYLDAVQYDDDFWAKLTPESAFMARTFNNFCQQNPEYQQMCEEKMPEVTRLGFYLQKHVNTLLENIRASSELGGGEEETVEQEFIVEQLLHIAQMLDYSDELGRRKMFSLLRETLAMPELPEESTRLTVEALRLVCGTNAAGEREFCSIVLEAIAEVHDSISATSEDGENGGDESFVSARSAVSDGSSASTSVKSETRRTTSSSFPPPDEEKALKEIIVNMKCLHIAQCMLQNVDADLQSNIHLVTMLNNLVIPAVRSHEAPLRERGLHCLGLCCLLDAKLARDNAALFRHCLEKGDEALQVISMQILSDIALVHPAAGPTAVVVDRDIFEVVDAYPASVRSLAQKSFAKLVAFGGVDGGGVQSEAVVKVEA